jgi:hypothetical protein
MPPKIAMDENDAAPAPSTAVVAAALTVAADGGAIDPAGEPTAANAAAPAARGGEIIVVSPLSSGTAADRDGIATAALIAI